MAQEVPLTRGLVALVDDDDYEFLAQWNWYATAQRYARRGYRVRGEIVCVYIHSVLLHVPKGCKVDHINRNTLDNRRSNLRIATHQENGRNRGKHKLTSSQYKGVTWDKRIKKWKAIIKYGRNITLGHFANEIDAARAYNTAAREYFGEFAAINQLNDLICH